MKKFRIFSLLLAFLFVISTAQIPAVQAAGTDSAIEVQIIQNEFFYDGDWKSPSYKVRWGNNKYYAHDNQLWDNIRVGSETRATEPGTYTIYIDIYGVGTATVEWKILKAPLVNPQYRWSTYTFKYTYDGNPHRPTLLGVNGPIRVDYSDAQTEAGTYQLTATFSSKYYELEPWTREFTIKPKDISGATVTLGDALTYNGTEQEQTVTSVSIDGLDATYEVSNNRAVQPGTYELTITGTGNFTGSVTKQYTIAEVYPTELTVTSAREDESTEKTTATYSTVVKDDEGSTLQGIPVYFKADKNAEATTSQAITDANGTATFVHTYELATGEETQTYVPVFSLGEAFSENEITVTADSIILTKKVEEEKQTEENESTKPSKPGNSSGSGNSSNSGIAPAQPSTNSTVITTVPTVATATTPAVATPVATTNNSVRSALAVADDNTEASEESVEDVLTQDIEEAKEAAEESVNEVSNIDEEDVPLSAGNEESAGRTGFSWVWGLNIIIIAALALLGVILIKSKRISE